jgi:hypothetical protein
MRDLFRHRGEPIGLAENVAAGQERLLLEGRLRVAGGVEHAEARPQRDRFPSQAKPVHARQHDVREEHVDRPVLPENGQGLLGIGRGDDSVALLRKEVHHELPDVGLIFDQ